MFRCAKPESIVPAFRSRYVWFAMSVGFPPNVVRVIFTDWATSVDASRSSDASPTYDKSPTPFARILKFAKTLSGFFCRLRMLLAWIKRGGKGC